MDKYVCTVCGYVYDPAEGDPDNGVTPGTAFEKVPEDNAKAQDFRELYAVHDKQDGFRILEDI